MERRLKVRFKLTTSLELLADIGERLRKPCLPAPAVRKLSTMPWRLQIYTWNHSHTPRLERNVCPFNAA